MEAVKRIDKAYDRACDAIIERVSMKIHQADPAHRKELEGFITRAMARRLRVEEHCNFTDMLTDAMEANIANGERIASPSRGKCGEDDALTGQGKGRGYGRGKAMRNSIKARGNYKAFVARGGKDKKGWRRANLNR